MSDDESDGEYDEALNHFDPLEDADEDADDLGAGVDSSSSEEDDEEDDETAAPQLPGGDPRMAVPGAAGIVKRVRDLIVVRGVDRTTDEKPTLAEITAVLALRSAMIAKHPSAFVDIGNMTTAENIAKHELLMGRSPMIIRRQVGVTPAGARIVEEWAVREMAIPARLFAQDP